LHVILRLRSLATVSPRTAAERLAAAARLLIEEFFFISLTLAKEPRSGGGQILTTSGPTVEF